MAKLDDGWDDDLAWYSALEKEAMKEATGNLTAEKKADEEKRLKESAGIIYTTAPKEVTETSYEHMRQTQAEYIRNENNESDEEEGRQN